MFVPQQTYRWLASIDMLSDEAELLDRKMVAVPPEVVPHFESGFIIGEIVKSILTRAEQPVPSCLDTIKMDTTKSAKATNWNLVWISFDDLRMQFDQRIKDLILQGETALIVEIVKQLYDRDERKDPKAMKMVKLHDKAQPQKQLKQKTANKNSSLDIRKINLKKNPDDSQSSLQFLILLLTSSLGLSVEEVLGLFTNQNKYLAHIIVKGVNEDFSGILLFYSLLNKHSRKFKSFCEDNPDDAHSCLYAIKPGFISKMAKISQLTLQLFMKLTNTYEWFVGEAKGSTTLLLGVKRHPHLASEYWNVLANIIKDEEVNFFTIHFKECFRDPEEMIEACNLLMPSIGQSYVKGKLLDLGVLGEWLEIAYHMFEGPLDSKILAFQFVGNTMLWIPEGIEENEEVLNLFRNGWQERKISQFIALLNELFEILQNLAYNRSTLASRVYQIIIDMFVNLNDQAEKKQYLVQNFTVIIPNYPKMPTHYFIEAYIDKYLRPSDYTFIQTAINQSQDPEGLARIGQTLFKMFSHDGVANHYMAPMIYTIAKKIIDDQIGQAFVRKIVKDALNYLIKIQSQKKNPQVAKPQQMYFLWKGNSEKLKEDEVDIYRSKERESENVLELIEKLAGLSKILDNDSLQTYIRQALLDGNAHLRKNTNKVGHKKLSNLLKKFGISKEDEYDYDEEYRNRKSIQQMQQSVAYKKQVAKNLSQMAASRVGGPENLRKEFSDMIEKRRKEEEERREEEERKMREDAMKETTILKELEVVKLMKGFGSGEAELKEFGFWQRYIKEQSNQIQLYPPLLMEPKDTEYIENLFRKYHKAVRYLFTKYTNTMYSIKSVNRFEDNQLRKETISIVEIIKFLKDYKLFFLTNSNEVQLLVRDLNVKLLNRKQITQQLDFTGFEHFLVQFSAVIYTKPHTISAVRKKGTEQIKRNLLHLSHAQLLEELFHYIKMVFAENGEKTSIFDEPEANTDDSDVIKEFNKRIEEDPTYILPEGFKKVTLKSINFMPKHSQSIKQGLSESYMDAFEILDQIFYESSLKMHILEAISQKVSKVRVKTNVFSHIKPKLNESMDGKTRILSSVIEKKSPTIPPIKMLERKVLSLGMKLGLSQVNYKDKLLGQQVAYVIDDMLTAVEKGKSTIQKEKITNQAIKKRKEMQEYDQKMERQKEKHRKDRKQELEKMKQEFTEKKEKQKEDTKEERQRKKQKKQSREKKRKEDEEKYKAEQQKKLADKRKKDDEEKKKEQEQKKKKKSEEKKAREKFQEFNKEQISKFQKSFDKDVEQRKKASEQVEEDRKHEDWVKRKLRHKIRADDKRIIEIRQKNNEEINNLMNSVELDDILKEFEPCFKGLFDFLIKNTFLSITERKHNHEVIFETWHYFNYAFQLCPLIISAKDIQLIFRSVTKDKEVRKQYYLGLNFEEFKEALVRVAIKHKTVFNKIAQKIKEDKMSEKEINSVINKDIEEKEKNEFDVPKDYNVKNLLKEEDMRKNIIDDYGDITKVTSQTLKGLIYYLKVPKDKKGQQERFRQVLAQKLQNKFHNYEKLRQKLKEEYTMKSPEKKEKVKNTSILKSEEEERNKSEEKGPE